MSPSTRLSNVRGIKMKVEVINIYSNEGFTDKNLKGDHGQSFYIKIGNKVILIDTGTNAKILLQNMQELGLSPDTIEKIFLTHGHYDHTRGLPGLLDTINPTNPIPVIGHPGIIEKKVGKLAFIKKDIGFPELTEEQKNKIDLQLIEEPIELIPGLTSTGEIKTRPHRDGREKSALHVVNDEFVIDPVLDDQSVVIDTQEGLVLITGCCHAGLLNTLEHVKRMKDKPIKVIIGGTHMVRFSQEEVSQVADVLEQEYGLPDLYLNHCTDYLPKPLSLVVKKTQATKLLRERFGDEKVKACPVGTKLTFEMQ